MYYIKQINILLMIIETDRNGDKAKNLVKSKRKPFGK